MSAPFSQGRNSRKRKKARENHSPSPSSSQERPTSQSHPDTRRENSSSSQTMSPAVSGEPGGERAGWDVEQGAAASTEDEYVSEGQEGSDFATDESSSSHAMDANLSVDDESDADASSSGMAPAYMDFDGQLVFKKSDNGRKRSFKRIIYEALRGRAMPTKPLIAAVLWAIFAVVISWVTRKGYRPHEDGDCRWWCSPLAVDGEALSYVGFALFLLTTFRVQESYARYMEAVRVWTSIGGTITSFAKYVCQAFEAGMFHRGDRERLLGFLAAFPVALKRELRNERDLRELKGVLTTEDLAKLQNAPSMPSYCLYVLSGYCLTAKRSERELPQTFLVHLIRWIADLAGAADTCNQIKTMPAPYSYISHLNMFLGCWLFFLPFALVESTGWGTILIVTFIAYGLLGVVQNAAELENPFGTDYNDLPLGRLARNIQDAVADTYRNSKRGRHLIVHEVPDEELKERGDYWLKEDKKDK